MSETFNRKAIFAHNGPRDIIIGHVEHGPRGLKFEGVILDIPGAEWQIKNELIRLMTSANLWMWMLTVDGFELAVQEAIFNVTGYVTSLVDGDHIAEITRSIVEGERDGR